MGDGVITKGYVQTSRGQVHYRSAGRSGARAPGLPLVLLHQTASSSRMFEKLIALLADRFWTFAPDTPGFGNSDPVPASIPAYAEVLAEALSAAGIERCHLFGHHSGASIAVELAVAHPERVERLILSGPPCLTPAQIEGLIARAEPIALDPQGVHFAEVWQRIRQKDPDAPLALSQREALLTLLAGENYPAAYRAVFAHAMPQQLARLTQAVLVIAGPDDPIFESLDRALGRLQRGRKKVLPRGGTYVCDREPELVAEAIGEFLGEG